MNRSNLYLKVIVFFCFILSQELHPFSIVFVHIGNRLPNHIYHTLSQARLFNEECDIYLIASKEAIQNANHSLKENEILCIPCESLVKSKAHKRLIYNPKQDWSNEGLWVYSSERFFYLEELMRKYNLLDVFHIESDVLLYADLEMFLPVFKTRYQGMIGAVFENDHRCVPSIVYVANLTPLKALIDFYPKDVHVLQADMNIIADFKNKYHKVYIDFLPITFTEYSEDYSLISESFESRAPELYSNNIDEFGAVFDGAAFGIYLAGLDSYWHPNSCAGTISKYSVINPSHFSLVWNIDDKGRRVPVISYKNKQYPLMNLHITNKTLMDQFLSVGILQ